MHMDNFTFNFTGSKNVVLALASTVTNKINLVFYYFGTLLLLLLLLLVVVVVVVVVH